MEWIDTSRLPRCRTLAERIKASTRLVASDLVLVHRDADNQPPDWRREEIQRAAEDFPHVAVVPVRTTEAWLLFDEPAIRAAAGRPSGREPLDLPVLGRVEELADPKVRLREVLLTASGATGRRRAQFDVVAARARIVDFVDDWAPLRRLAAFRQLEADLRRAFSGLGLPLFPDPGTGSRAGEYDR